MVLEGWIDKVNGVDTVDANDINRIAAAVRIVTAEAEDSKVRAEAAAVEARECVELLDADKLARAVEIMAQIEDMLGKIEEALRKVVHGS